MPLHRRVLVVEDEREIREALMELLLEVGHSVASACDGAEGLQRVREFLPHLVLLDLFMPRMSGWTFRKAQTADPRVAEIPVIVISGASPEEARSVEASAYLPKPFNVKRLLHLVEHVVPERSRRSVP